jgi:hypothetical protein
MRLVRELETDGPFGAGLRLGPGLNIKRAIGRVWLKQELKPTLFDPIAGEMQLYCGPCAGDLPRPRPSLPRRAPLTAVAACAAIKRDEF